MIDKDINLAEYFLGSGRVVLTGSSAMQYAFEGDKVQGEGVPSSFTRTLVKGLETGKADLDGDGWISLDELYNYTYDRVIDETPQQQPGKWSFGIEGMIIIARNPHLSPAGLKAELIEIATRALADTPSEVDLLGFSDYAEALADFIKNEKTSKPLTIGIDAPWGMGKTTLMHMIRNQMVQQATKHKRSFPVVWFNAWKYDREESLWAALVLEILTQVRKQFNVWQQAWFWVELNWKRFDWGRLLQSVLKSLAYVLGIGLLGAVGLGTALLGMGTTLQEAIQRLGQYTRIVGGLGVITALYATGKEAFDRIAGPFDLKISQYVREPHYEERVGFLSQFEEDFKRVIDVITDGGKWPLIVFIDDLDRCAPPKPVEIVEAINLLLDAEHCVFIIGMDAQTVAGSIEAKYKDLKDYLGDADDSGELTLGQRFLEKIVQINFRIPRVESRVVGSFIDASLDTLQAQQPTPSKEGVAEVEELIKAEQRGGKSLREAVQAIRAARPDILKKVIEEARREAFVKSFDDSEDVRRAIREAAPYLALNPRKIKRFINLFRLLALIANRRGLLETGIIQLGLLAKWVVIETRWPDMVKGITADKGFIERLKQAYQIRDELLKVEHEPDQERRVRASFDTLLADLRIKRLIDATDLAKLLEDVTAFEIESLPHYLSLAQVTTSEPSPAAGARADV